MVERIGSQRRTRTHPVSAFTRLGTESGVNSNLLRIQWLVGVWPAAIHVLYLAYLTMQLAFWSTAHLDGRRINILLYGTIDS